MDHMIWYINEETIFLMTENIKILYLICVGLDLGLFLVLDVFVGQFLCVVLDLAIGHILGKFLVLGIFYGL